MHIDPESNIGFCLGVEIQDKVQAGSERDTPNFLYATLDKTACAPFF